MFGKVRNKLQAKGLILFPILKLSRENTHLENVWDVVFWKGKIRCEKVNRTSVYAEQAIWRVL